MNEKVRIREGDLDASFRVDGADNEFDDRVGIAGNDVEVDNAARRKWNFCFPMVQTRDAFAGLAVKKRQFRLGLNYVVLNQYVVPPDVRPEMRRLAASDPILRKAALVFQ
ncbi:hypothetical protein [Rhodoblastus sp.]|uniref:hypothetical protein n=1 Tax=Rhodoblastus sp. TaxID=1962975 RepID=UPI0035ADA51A